MAKRKFYRKIYPVRNLRQQIWRIVCYIIKLPFTKISNRVYQKSEKKRRIFFILKFFIFGFWFFIFGFLFLFLYYAKDLPRPEKFAERELAQSTKIFDRTGNILLYEIYGEEKRSWVPLEKVPEHLRKAVILTEDKNFYRHPGIDLKGIIRAIVVDLKLGKPIQGASTIPQQLIRSSFLSREKTAERKTREIILTLELSRRYTKDQILEWYLNQVPFGSNTYGVEAASQTLFRKSVSEISLAESATLAALIRAPSYLSPFGKHKDALLSIKNNILETMAEDGYLKKEEAEAAKKEELKFSKILQPIKAPHFAMMVRDYLIKKYGKENLERKGFRVYTTLDWEMQELAEEAVKGGAEKNKKYGVYNAALVAIAPKTGEVLSLVGSADWYATSSYPEGCQPQSSPLAGKNCLFEPKFDIAVLGERQPGSAFKPFVYATAFKKGYSDKTVVVDEKTNFGTPAHPYIPQNYDGLFRGPVTLRQALAQSLNVPAVKVLAGLAGLEDSIKTARDLGITTLTKSPSFYGLPLVLGAGEVNLLELTSAYGVFATEGLRIPPVFILKIIDAKGNIIEENEKVPQRVLGKEIAHLINSILSDNEARAPMFGQRSPLYFDNEQVAVKTGTTQSHRDAWTIGHTSLIVVGVWAGNNNNSPPKVKKPGIYSAGQIWRKFMDEVLPIIKKP